MAKDKKFNREAEAIWDAVRRDRRARRKLTAMSELQESAAILRAHADALDALAARQRAAEAPADSTAPPQASAEVEIPKAKRKGGRSRKSKKGEDA